MLKLISIHIPKTGGTSFFEVLRKNYPGHAVMWKRVDVEDALVNGLISVASIPKGTQVLHGHVYAVELKELIQPETKLITWLRHPVDRVISNYYFFQHRLVTGKAEERQQHRMGESVVEYASGKHVRNVMSQYLDGLALERFYFIGVLEFYDQDLLRLSQKMNWSILPQEELNTRPPISVELPPITDEDKANIASLNQTDMDLYEAVLKRHSR